MGRLAKTYGMLPSEVALKATTYDLLVTDALATYEEYEYYKSQGKVMPQTDTYSESELLAIMEKVNE